MNMKSHIIGNWVKGFFFAVFLLSVGLSRVATAQTGEPSREPILRIETGMHIAPVKRIGVDSAGKYLVTASDDKTARVWEVTTGRLLRILRVPIGDGREGRLYAVAISPDGNTVAVGGWTSTSLDGLHESIYLFDRESGRLTRRLTGLPIIVDHLAFSPDGTLLAATLGGTKGVRVWRTSDWREAGADEGYGAQSYGADFDHAGRLVTSSLDGLLRLYDRNQRLLVKHKGPGGNQPFGVRFSPDGHKVAVGYIDSAKVDVLSGDTLMPLYSADTSGIEKGDMHSVAWSTDGAMLYGAGTYQSDGANRIRRWDDEGRGHYLEAPAADNNITDIASLPSGRVAYSTGDPAWGIFDGSLKRTHLQVGQIADYRQMLARFLTSATASTIRFAYESFGKSPAVFSVADRKLAVDASNGDELRAPRTETSSFSVTDWYNTCAPRLNSELLFGKECSEISRSLAIVPDGQGFLLGTNENIRFDNRHGQWRVPAPGEAWSVNISGDGNLALAAFGDGTIRWYRISDGKELLAFFPHADRKRWVLWTPSGYYDASPGAEELIGWQINNGRDQAADFFAVGQFRSTYYRPDVISKILETGDEARALQLANEERGRKAQTSTVAQMLPPVVEIASPADNSEVSSSEVTIRYSLRSPSGETVTNVRALVDGRPASGNRQLTREDASAPGVRELKVSMPEHDSEVSIIAENKFAASVPATIRLRWHGSAATTEAFVIQPKLYVLAIGVSQYLNPSYSLKFAAKDAKDFAAAVATQKGFLYRDVVVKVLTDDQATKDNVLDGLDWIRKETTSKDVAMVFFAGHGLNDQNGVYYFLPYNTDLEKLLRTGVPFTDIKNTVQSLAGKTLFFIDTCHSGNVLGGRRGLADDLNGIINELSSADSGAVVFAASTGNQYSLEDAKWNNGAFTKALVEGFTGRADYTGKGRITINMLDLYISERVKELTGGKQTPTTAKPNTIQDFPIAVKR
jgi:WD40 repeat protein